MKTPTIPNKNEVRQIIPLGDLPVVNNMLPEDNVEFFPKSNSEDGSKPLKNRKQEAFCVALTGWGGDGKPIPNYKAYEIAYGKTGSTARSESTHLLARPEVAARVRYLEKKVSETSLHNKFAIKNDILEIRMRAIERAKIESRMLPVAMVAARDIENALGLKEVTPTVTQTVEETREASGNEFDGITEILKRMTRKTTITEGKDT